MISNMTGSIDREVTPCQRQLKASADCGCPSRPHRPSQSWRYLQGSMVAACRICSVRPLETESH
jgi:hypothetical protein